MSKRKAMWDQRYRDKAESVPNAPEFLLSWLTRLPDGSVLDLACGDGAVALHLAQNRRFEVSAVDFSAVALERLDQFAQQRQLRINSFQADFDLSCSLDTLGAFKSVVVCRYKMPDNLLAHLHELLLPQGVVLVATFNRLHHQLTGFPERLTLKPWEYDQLPGLNLLEYRNGEEQGEGVDVYLFQKAD